MKKNVTYVARESFDAIVADLGLATKTNAGFTQVSLGNGYHAYVANTKRVGRVDLQFLPEGPGYEDLGEARFGRIVAQVDFTQSEDAILEAFATALVHGAKLPQWVKPKREGKPAESLPQQSEEARKEMMARVLDATL